ncbi:hypothetical protein Tco_0565384 [Tanacetum coccineum]
MEELATNDKANYYSGITSIMVNGKRAYELKGKFLDDLRKNTFSGTNGEDAVEHIEYFLKIIGPINLQNVNYERLRLSVFPISLVGNASKWFDKFKGSITTWVDLTEIFFGKYYPPSGTSRMTETNAKWDPTDVKFEECNNQEKVIDNGFSNLEEANNNKEQEIGEIFRIETNLFDYETPLCAEFNEFNYLLKKSFGDFHELDYELLEKPKDYWRKVNDHKCSPFANWRSYIRGPYANYYSNFLDMKEHEDEERCELFDDQERPVCNIRRFEMIKYSFGEDEEYVSIRKMNTMI